MRHYLKNFPGRAFVRPGVVAAVAMAIAIAAATSISSGAQATELRPKPISQLFDDDCGVPAVAMLLRSAGVVASPAELVAGLEPNAREDALSGTDLIRMVSHVDRGVELVAGFVPVSRLQSLAARETMIILMRTRAFGGAVQLDHFIVVERRLSEGFLVADPMLASRAFLSDDLLERDAHSKVIDGKIHILVFRLMRGRLGAAPAAAENPEDAHIRPWEVLHRLPRPLPPGKWTIATSFVHGHSQSGSLKDLRMDQRALSKRLLISRGLTPRTQVGIELNTSEGETRLRIPGDNFTLGGGAASSGRLIWSYFPDRSLPWGMTGSTSLSAAWRDVGMPSELSGTVQLDRRIKDLAFNLVGEIGVDAHSGKAVVALTPSVTYDKVLPNGLAVGIAMSAPSIDMRKPDHLYASVSASRSISPNLSAAMFYQQEVLEKHGMRERQFGFTVTYGIPRPMRKASAKQWSD